MSLTPDQVEAQNKFFAFLSDPTESCFIIEGYAGCGKEQPVSTTVQTPNGPTRFGDLTTDSYVFGADGQPTKVTKIFPQGIKKVFKVTFRDGTHTLCGKNHLWSVHTKSNKNTFYTKTTQELIDAGINNSGGSKFGVPLCKPVNYEEKSYSFDPYFIGAVIGDGYLGGTGTPAISCSNADIDIIQRIQSTLPQDFSLNFRQVGSCPQYNIVDNGIFNRNRFKEYILTLGLNTKSEFKFIPTVFLQGSVSQRIALLNGLMDTDGCSFGNRISYSTKSLQLAKDVQTLVQSLGGIAILYTQNRTKENKGMEYKVNVKTTFNPFSCKRKAKNWRYSAKNPPSKYITAITEEGDEDQMCIMVDAKDHLYLTDSFIVTHNSHLVQHILDEIPKRMAAVKLLCPEAETLGIELTATTNKAAEALKFLSNMPVSTIHALLGLRVQTDYSNNTSKLVVGRNAEIVRNAIIFIDEASYIDLPLMRLIFAQTDKCKLVFIGDPAQLSPVKSSSTPIFDQPWPKAQLTNVVRQAKGSPIIELATKFRETVTTGEFFKFKPDGNAIVYLDRAQFQQKIEAEFTRPDWHHADSKVLAWTNKCVIAYNHYIRDLAKADPQLGKDDYAIVNSFIAGKNKASFKTDQTVLITGVSMETEQLKLKGKLYTLDGISTYFMPNSNTEKNALLKELRKDNDVAKLEMIDREWIDLRAAYAVTVNKSQGSTYDRVFIDLTDISRVNSGNTLARMLYVAVSRARTQVILTGDIHG